MNKNTTNERKKTDFGTGVQMSKYFKNNSPASQGKEQTPSNAFQKSRGGGRWSLLSVPKLLRNQWTRPQALGCSSLVRFTNRLRHKIFNISHIEGILLKGPYLPCVNVAGMVLLAGYRRYILVYSPHLKKIQEGFPWVPTGTINE